MSELRTPGSDTSAVAVAAAAGGTCVGTAAEASLSSLSGIGAEWIGDIRVSSLRKDAFDAYEALNAFPDDIWDNKQRYFHYLEKIWDN
ncbi:hypothetical protein [Oryza sativa Japonica Group]|uniref:Uncharacterized protein n=2 Tax=Oryza sativa subsp. japonica TaxID=39947 RepID=A0A0P0V9I6_ORYSJ|nr:hypothetical protein EE612_006409 [Oryza sativa]BAD68199.1 hypothetical protein [Oryza sativa Japonica Group]BAD68241.1 hypothetical protein [Oryza sativa Japonica Group]BAS74872.1 Os01g0810866 [Oryza sativa Japonica Group]